MIPKAGAASVPVISCGPWPSLLESAYRLPQLLDFMLAYCPISCAVFSSRLDLAFDSQSLHTNDLPFRATHNPVLNPRPIPRHGVYPHIVPLARLPHSIYQIAILALRIPLRRIPNRDVRVVRVPVVNQLRELNYYPRLLARPSQRAKRVEHKPSSGRSSPLYFRDTGSKGSSASET